MRRPLDRNRKMPPFNLARDPLRDPRYFSGSFDSVERTCLAFYVSACSRQPPLARAPRPVIPRSAHTGGTPDAGGAPLSARTWSGVARDVVTGWENDDDNGARRNRSEPNASALGIELSKPAALASSLLLLRDVRRCARYRGDEERAAAGESASPSRGSRKHQRARQQHQRVGQIIPTYPLASRERARRRAREKRGRERLLVAADFSPGLVVLHPNCSLILSLSFIFSLSLSFSHIHSLVLLFSSFTGTFRGSELKLDWSLIGCLRPCEMGRASWCGLVRSACKRLLETSKRTSMRFRVVFYMTYNNLVLVL